PRSAIHASQGVTVNATTIDIAMATGTLSAIGRMYGPIMPVMNIIGRNETTAASVASTIGGRTSFTARRTAASGGSARMRRWRKTFSTSTIGSSTTSPSERISANSVTRLIV